MLFKYISILFALVAAILAQSQASSNPFKVLPGFSITAGQSKTVEWSPTTQGPVTLTLRSGSASNLNKGTVIASSIPNSGSYTFTVPSSTPAGSDYTLAINPVSDPSNMNYTPQFTLDSTASASPSGSGASSAATASMSSAPTSKATMSMSASASSTSPSSSSSSSTSSSRSSSTPAPSNAASQPQQLAGMGAMGLVAVFGAALAL